MNKFLCNESIVLRPVEPEDAEFMWEVESDSVQWVQNSIVAPFSKENLRKYAENYEADPFLAGQLRLIITDKFGKYYGIADLYDISAQHRTAWVGIYILPSYRNVGIASETLSTLEDYAFKLLNLHHLGAKIVEGNETSRNLFIKNGYEPCGLLIDWLISGYNKYSINLFQKTLQ